MLYPDFAKRVRDAMRDHGVTKTDIVRELKLKTHEMARRYIVGLAKPRHDKMVQLARLLRFQNAAALEYGTEEPSATPMSAAQGRPHYAIGNDALEIARAFEKLSPALQSSMRTLIFTMAAAHSVARWLVIEPPKGDGYQSWERAIEKAYAAEIKQMKLDFER